MTPPSTKDATAALILFAQGVPGLLAKWTGDAFRKVGGPGPWIKDRIDDFQKWAATLPRRIGKFAGDVWAQVRKAGRWLADRWAEFQKWADALPSRFARAAGDVWEFVKKAGAWLADRWAEFSRWAGSLASRIGRTAGNIWRDITGPSSWLGRQWSTFSRWLSAIPGKVGKALSGIWSRLPNFGSFLAKQLRGLGPIGNAAADMLGLPGSAPKAKAKGKGFGGGGSFGGSSASGRWAGTINSALRAAGAPAGWAGDIQTIIDHESSGNPNAINNWDDNAKAGRPSQGLMQEIPSTFAAYSGSYFGRGIRDPFANIYAGIRYIKARYGSPENLAGIKSVRRGGP